MAYVGPPVWDYYGEVGKRASECTFFQANICPDDVDVLELYDPFSFEIIRQLGVFGFCSMGEGGDFVMDGHAGLAVEVSFQAHSEEITLPMFKPKIYTPVLSRCTKLFF